AVRRQDVSQKNGDVYYFTLIAGDRKRNFIEELTSNCSIRRQETWINFNKLLVLYAWHIYLCSYGSSMMIRLPTSFCRPSCQQEGRWFSRSSCTQMKTLLNQRF